MSAGVLAAGTAANAAAAATAAEYHVGAGIWDITGPAADAAASHRAHLSSPAGDAAKNALLAAVSLHGALAAGRDLAARGLPFGNVDAPTDAELANVTLDARRRAQRFLEVHGDDVDADVFRRFLAGA